MTELTAADIRRLLDELGRRLDDRGVHGSLYIVGGAAIALEFDSRRITADIDAILDPPTTIAAVAADMAGDHGLPPDWLNSNAAAFVPGADADPVRYDSSGLSIALASPRHLLAMKMARGTDIDDLITLFSVLEIEHPEQAADIALDTYGPDSVVLTERDDLVLLAREVLQRMQARDS